ncbi:MAG: Mannosyltransferase [Frankiales bacterium]|nr:Mannosyltransferase [Frankiales bacterium]
MSEATSPGRVEVSSAAHLPASGAKISATGLEVRFGTGPKAVHALGPLDLTVRDGEFVCLVGPSGCGKSTFVKLVAGLLTPTAGRLEVSLRGDTSAPIATVFQDFGIFPWKTVESNVRFGLSVSGVPKKEARERARDWLSRMGLLEFAGAYPGTLSGGMRQRVAIARAMAVEPEILLMDEPFASLDAQLREMLQDDLLEICQASSRTVVFVTHSLEEALVLGDRVVVMTARPGRLLDDTVVPFARPRGADVRESAEFSALRSKLWGHLRSEVQTQIAGQRPEVVAS